MPDQEPYVLVVDDSRTTCEMMIRILSELGMLHLRMAHCGEAALESIRIQRPEIVFLDWVMPLMTGLEVLKEIRKEPRLKDMPVVMITSYSNSEMVVEALEAGANGYIVKPFNIKTVEQKLKQFAPVFGGSLSPNSETVSD